MSINGPPGEALAQALYPTVEMTHGQPHGSWRRNPHHKTRKTLLFMQLELKLELWSPAYTSTMSILNIFHDKGRLDFLTLHLIPFSKNTTFQLSILLHMSVSLCYFCKDGNESGQETYFVWFAMCYGHVLGFSDTKHLKNSCAVCAHLWSKMTV